MYKQRIRRTRWGKIGKFCPIFTPPWPLLTDKKLYVHFVLQTMLTSSTPRNARFRLHLPGEGYSKKEKEVGRLDYTVIPLNYIIPNLDFDFSTSSAYFRPTISSTSANSISFAFANTRERNLIMLNDTFPPYGPIEWRLGPRLRKSR